MIELSVKDGRLVLKSEREDLAPRLESQLAYWGFNAEGDTQFSATTRDLGDLASKVHQYLCKLAIPVVFDGCIEALLIGRQAAAKSVESARQRGRELKAGNTSLVSREAFLEYLRRNLRRQLKGHQVKAALHLLAVQNGANFSVPGSGKTAVVLSAFAWLRHTNVVDALFVVGPPSCFGPWRWEYEQTLGDMPSYEILAGGDVAQRHIKYGTDISSVCDLYLTTFQTLSKDWQEVQVLFSVQGVRFFLVIDEAHYIKQLDGKWANAALTVARHASRRCVLTGTPFPRSYIDAFNLFDALWPECNPISKSDKHKISALVKRGDFTSASDVLRANIEALFYRVRKRDLNLAPQVLNEPIRIAMNPVERRVHDAILDRIQIASQTDYFRDLNLVLRLRRGRMIRLRQCISYVALLKAALEDYEETLYEHDESLAKVIANYDEIEVPAKLTALRAKLVELRAQSQKVVIWSNFIGTLQLIHATVTAQGYGAHLIYGAIPLQRGTNWDDELTRERRIEEFISPQSGIDILIANPAACAESISLHRTCSHAIYYDLSYNCAQYLQSLDRIHRVGGSEHKPSHYHFLQYDDTIDFDILDNVRGKAERMSNVIDEDYAIYSLDMFDEDDELSAYERLFERRT